MTTVRCPMRECRRAIDLDALSARQERPPCLHFVAGWGEERGPLAEAVLAGLDGNREFLIRNFRPQAYTGAGLDAHRAGIEADARRFAHVVDDRALFADPFERDALGRALTQRILGVDPMVGGVMRR